MLNLLFNSFKWSNANVISSTLRSTIFDVKMNLELTSIIQETLDRTLWTSNIESSGTSNSLRVVLVMGKLKMLPSQAQTI